MTAPRLIIATAADQADPKRMALLRKQADAIGAELLIAPAAQSHYAKVIEEQLAAPRETVRRTDVLKNLEAVAGGKVRVATAK